MKRNICSLFVLLVILTLIANRYSYADGAFFSNLEEHLYEPEQKAIIAWDGQKESMIVSSKVSSDDIKNLYNIAWLIPLESLDKPEVYPSDISIFETFIDVFALPEPSERDSIGERFGWQDAGSVELLESKKIDIYDISILKATDAEELFTWLTHNGYVFSETVVPMIREYMKNRIFYFVVNKIDLANKIGSGSLAAAEISKLSHGIATPLRIDFHPQRPMYPLMISAINKGQTKIEIYFCGPKVVEDSNGILKYDDVRIIPFRTKKEVAPFLNLDKTRYATRFSYKGELSELSKDAIFKDSLKMNVWFGESQKKSEDEAAFENIFSTETPQEQQLIAKRLERKKILDEGKHPGYWAVQVPIGKENELRQLDKEIESLEKTTASQLAEKLKEFVEKYPASIFADDAVVLLITMSNSAPILATGELHRLYDKISSQPISIEDFTLRECPFLRGETRYIESSLINEYLMLRLAMFCKAEKNYTVAAELAKEIVDSLSTPEKKKLFENGQNRELSSIKSAAENMSSENLYFEEYFYKGVEAYRKEDWVIAKEMFKKVISQKGNPIFPYSDSAGEERMRPMAYYLLGSAVMFKGEYREALKAYRDMVETDPDYCQTLFFKGEIGTFMSICSGIARSRMSVCYLKVGDVDKGLQEGLKALELIKEQTPNAVTVLANTHYNIACAYALKGDKVNAMAHIKESLNLDPSLKAQISKDEDLKILHEEQAFRELIK